jgi:periplasmic divalent cation tolerance protein
MTNVVWVYMTTPSAAVAEQIGRHLIEQQLAACVNVLDGMRSLYWWDGAVQDETETILIAKTTQERFPALEEHVKQMHPYECPCILALPVSAGHAPFLQWIQRMTAQGRG